jgi:tRNA threonylcarbamoyladenosine biosynthesis protein TsaB
MNVLALDTCFPALSVAVGSSLASSHARVLSRTEPMATGHAERLLPLIGSLLDEAGLVVADIDRVVVTVGPGSFTGTRIGIAAARAFKLARHMALVPITSLEAIALSPLIAAAPGEDVVVAVDAHRGEAYVQVFDAEARQSSGPPRLLALSDLASLQRGRPVLAIGTAAGAVAEAINASGGKARAQPDMIFPDMAAAVIWAATREPVTAPIEPLYLRPPDAKPQEGKSLERAGA